MAFGVSAVDSGPKLTVAFAVRTGLADLASIDCVTYAGLERYSPEAVAGLNVVGYTESYPGLPLITSGKTSAKDRETMQRVFTGLFSNADASKILNDLGIVGFETPPANIYQRCTDMRDAAIAQDYPTLA